MRIRTILGLLSLLLAAAGALSAQGPGRRGRGRPPGPQAQPPVAAGPLVDIKGKIAKVQIAPGEGMPFLEVQHDGETTKVYLGSMRYLMQQDFNPKAGEDVEIKGYKTGDDLVAAVATLPGQKKTLRLRDGQGWPVWGRGGRGGRGRAW
ncbi:MAG: hypothetical protein IT158_14105 [Bryobacterales bacterium]|nr:hypothetical protein [Bryobacterales bacterium]